MFEGINTLANLNQNNLDTVQGQVEGVYEVTPDAVEGKVNPVEPVGNMAEESSLTDKTRSQDKPSQDSGDERIIDMLG